MAELGFQPMEDFDVAGKRVLLRVDINSPIDPDTKTIVNNFYIIYNNNLHFIVGQ